MSESKDFRRILLAEMAKRDLNEAELSLKAGLNRRAVTDIREDRVRSPKISTVFALAKALDMDPGELLGLGPCVRLDRDLTEYLSQYDEDGQKQLLAAIRAFPPALPSGQ